MKYTWLYLVAVGAGIMGCPSLWASQATRESYGFFIDTTAALFSSSSSSLASTPIQAPHYDETFLPGSADLRAEPESERFSHISSTSASSSSTPTVLSERQCRQKFNFVCQVPIAKSPDWGKLAAFKVYPRLCKAQSEIVAVVYCCQINGKIGALVDVGTGVELAPLEGLAIESETDFYAVEVTADNDTLIVAAGNTIHFFDAQTGKRRECVQLAADKQITQFVSSKSGVFLLGFSDGTVAMVHYGKAFCVPQMLSYPAKYMALSSDGLLSAFVDNSGVLRVFATKTGLCAQAITLSGRSGVTALAFENNLLVVVCSKVVSLFTGSSGFHLDRTLEFTSAVSKIAIDPSGRYIAFGFADKTVHLYAGTTKLAMIHIAGDITGLAFTEHELKIYSANKQFVRRIQGVDLADRFALISYVEAFHESSERVSYGDLFAVYETHFGDLVCSRCAGEEEGLEVFEKVLSSIPGDRLLFLFDLSEYAQKIWDQLSSFTQRALVTKFPLFIPDPMQAAFVRALIKRIGSIGELGLYQLSESEEALFGSCNSAVQKKLMEDYPRLLHNNPQDLFAQMLDSRTLTVTEHTSFMGLRPSVRASIVEHNPNIITSDLRLVRAFWHMIDAIGLGRFSRRTIRLSTAVLVAAALGIGAWRVWAK